MPLFYPKDFLGDLKNWWIINSPLNRDPNLEVDCHQNRFYTYGVIGRLALLAAAHEITNALS